MGFAITKPKPPVMSVVTVPAKPQGILSGASSGSSIPANPIPSANAVPPTAAPPTTQTPIGGTTPPAATTPTAPLPDTTTPPLQTGPTTPAISVPDQPTFNVPENATVAGQLQQNLAGNSPYLQAARQAGMQTAAQRGLLNSSLAAGAAESSAINAALPIAQADAATNQQANLATFNSQASERLQQLNAQNSNVLQSSQLAQTRQGEVNNNISQILQNKDLNLASKTKAINILLGLYQSSLDLQSAISGHEVNYKVPTVSADSGLLSHGVTDGMTADQMTMYQTDKPIIDRLQGMVDAGGGRVNELSRFTTIDGKTMKGDQIVAYLKKLKAKYPNLYG